MRRGSAFVSRPSGAARSLRLRCSCRQQVLFEPPILSLSVSHRRYATPPTQKSQTKFLTKEEQKRKNKQKRIKKLLKESGEEGGEEYITPENYPGIVAGGRLENFSLTKTDEDHPLAKEFAFTASGQQLSYDSMAKMLEDISNTFSVNPQLSARVAALLTEIKDKEFDLSGQELAIVKSNPNMGNEEKEWFSQFPEYSGELDEPFLSLTQKQLRSILYDRPGTQDKDEAETVVARDRNEGRTLFKFAEGKEIYIGGHFSFTDGASRKIDLR